MPGFGWREKNQQILLVFLFLGLWRSWKIRPRAYAVRVGDGSKAEENAAFGSPRVAGRKEEWNVTRVDSEGGCYFWGQNVLSDEPDERPQI